MSFGQPTQIDEKVASAPTVQPPSYQTTTEAPNPPPAVTELGLPIQNAVHRRRRFRRFCHFFIASLFIWVTASHVLRHCKERRFGRPPHFDSVHWDPDFDLGLPSTRPGESIDSCVESAQWTDVDPPEAHNPHEEFPVWKRAELSLPSDADDIFLLSRGFHALGHLQIIEAADREDIGVEVVVGYHDVGDLFERSSLCTLSRGDNGHGIAIFTPRFDHGHHKRDRIFFNITLSLPEGEEVITVPHFETRLPLFSQIVAGLPTHVFSSISLHSTNRPIFTESLVGDKISVRSKNGPIEGTFNTSSSLNIETSNAPVRVAVNAFNQNNSAPTNVKIRTRNGILSADLSLFSTFENSTSGAFTVVTSTSNSPLDVKFLEHAPDGLLKLDMHTSNSPAEVQLHPSFEGTLKLRTSLFTATVSPDLEVEDPAGRGRTHSVNVSTVGRHSRSVYGEVEWKPEDEALKPDGKVEVSTSNSPLYVRL